MNGSDGGGGGGGGGGEEDKSAVGGEADYYGKLVAQGQSEGQG